MIEKVEITRKEVYGSDPLRHSYHVHYGRFSPIGEVYEYTLRFGDKYCRVIEDFHMQEMRVRMKPEEYNEYITERLTNEMLKFIRNGIKQAVQQQAANNAPKRDNMAYLFGDK